MLRVGETVVIPRSRAKNRPNRGSVFASEAKRILKTRVQPRRHSAHFDIPVLTLVVKTTGLSPFTSLDLLGLLIQQQSVIDP
jgi:hypothetical protein